MKLFSKKTVDPLMQGIKKEDLKHVNDLQAALHAEKHHGLFYVLTFLFLFALVFLIWASFSKLEIITRAEGKVIASQGNQIIQSLDPGSISELLVKEGQEVVKGQLLVKIDPTRSAAQYGEVQAKVASLKAMASRLRAEATGLPLAFPSDVPIDIQQRERAAFVSRLRAVQDSISGIESSKRLLDREIAVTSPMVAKGVMSEVELLRSKRQSNDLAIQITERRNKYRADADSELQRIESELRQAEENLLGRKDAFVRTEIRSPVHGTVKNIRNTTIGGVVAAGQEIMDIVPKDDQLLIEAYVKPKDIAFLKPGLKGLAKFSAYEFSTYGGLNGEIVFISPDTLQDEQRRQSQLDFDPNTAVYRILFRTNEKEYLYPKKTEKDPNPKPLSILPGMLVTVDIKTGDRTVLQYIFKPVTRVKQAMTEQ